MAMIFSAFLHRRPAALAWDLMECPHCGMSFLCPVGSTPRNGRDEVRLLLRCGQCEAWRRVTVSPAEAEQLHQDYEHARGLMSRAAAALAHDR